MSLTVIMVSIHRGCIILWWCVEADYVTHSIMVSIHRGCIILRWCVEADYVTHSYNGKHA